MTNSKKLGLSILIVIPLLCGLAGVGLTIAAQQRAEAADRAELDECRKLGMPLEPSQLVRAPAPDNLNAALLYRRMGNMLWEKRYAAAVELISKAHQWRATTDDIERARRALRTIEPTLILVTELDRRTECNFNLQWSKGYEMPYDDYNNVHWLAKLLLYEVDAEEAHQDWSGSLKTLAYEERMATDVGGDPMLMSMGEEISLRRSANKSYERFIQAHSKNSELLARVEGQIKRYDSLPNMRYALGAEEVFERMALARVRSSHDLLLMGEDHKHYDLPPAALDKMIFESAEVHKVLDAKLISAWKVAWRQFPLHVDDWQGYEIAFQAMDTEVRNDNSPEGVANKCILRGFSFEADDIGKLQAQNRMLLTSIELLRIRNKTGSLPAVLPSSLGQMRIDPFDGKPLRYRRQGSGFLLYSIGTDRKDDGGVDHFKTEDCGHDDVMRFH